MQSLLSFLSLIAIWSALYVGYSISMKQFQEGE